MTEETGRRTPKITGPDLLRAVSNPFRMRLYELLVLRGPATVGMLAERSGGAVGQVSYHVRQLARYGYVTEDPALARECRERLPPRAVRTASLSGSRPATGSAPPA